MNITAILLLLCVAALVCCDNYSPTKEETEALEKWGDVAGDALGVIENDDVDSIIDLTGDLLSAVPYIGPFAGLITGLIKLFVPHPAPTPDPMLVKIQEQLVLINRKLFSLDRKMDKVIEEIREQFVINTYNTHLEMLIDLQLLYDRYSTNPTNATLDALTDRCHLNTMLDFTTYLANGITTDKTLMTFMTSDYDQAKFIRWSKVIMLRFTHAIMLHSMCIGLTDPDPYDANKTLHGDSIIFGTEVQKMQATIKASYQNLRSNFFGQAKYEVENYMASHTDYSYDQFTDTLYDQLTAKYPWRRWFVLEHDCDAEWAYTIYFDRSYYWRNVFDRCLLVSSTNVNDPGYNNYIFSILDPRYYSGISCESARAIAKSVLTDYEFVFCMTQNINANWVYDANAASSLKPYWNTIYMFVEQNDQGQTTSNSVINKHKIWSSSFAKNSSINT